MIRFILKATCWFPARFLGVERQADPLVFRSKEGPLHQVPEEPSLCPGESSPRPSLSLTFTQKSFKTNSGYELNAQSL